MRAKKVWAIVLSVAMTLTSFSVPAMADEIIDEPVVEAVEESLDEAADDDSLQALFLTEGLCEEVRKTEAQIGDAVVEDNFTDQSCESACRGRIDASQGYLKKDVGSSRQHSPSGAVSVGYHKEGEHGAEGD